MPDSFAVLIEIRKSYRIIGYPLSLTFLHSMLTKKLKISSKMLGNQLRYLHKSNRIEFVGDRIKPVGEIKNGSVDEKDIRDVLLDLKKAKPSEAYHHFLDKFNVFVNPETFTRLMRKMAENGKIFSENGYYYLKNKYEQKRLI